MNVSKDMINQARLTNLVDFLQSNGVGLKFVGNGNYVLSEHDSCSIKENKFNWFSRSISGNAIDFVMAYYNVSFVDGVLMLCSSSAQTIQLPSVSEFSKKDYVCNYSHDKKRSIAYLCNTRKLSYDIIKPFLLDNTINQDVYGNIHFLSIGNAGAEVCGTCSDVRYKKILGDYRGFTVCVGDVRLALIFESSIDLLSYYQLNFSKIHDCVMISMGGLKPNIIDGVLSRYRLSPSLVWLCTDNDNPSRQFVVNQKQRYPDIKTFLPKTAKDWNEILCLKGS